MAFFLCFVLLFLHGAAADYILDNSHGVGRVYDGIGGLSGGGATSRLLYDYPSDRQEEILDLLFKPQYGASLNILKVEIGGDAQSTDGTEPSHMHTEDDLNFDRGYEWWLMKEAKKRNPNIKFYGLSWAFPAWVGQGSGSPYKYPEKTTNYTIQWILGAKKHHNLTIDYVGIWNERQYDANYIIALRNDLNKSNLSHVQIVAADCDGTLAINMATDVIKSKTLSEAVSILGVHYPGTNSTADALKSNKTLWASEDYSTFNNKTGAGCWARILNRNYVHGYMTSTISWNLVASYYDGLPFFRDGLMTAVEPWSGHYEVNGPIWISAHTTQFVQPGVHYLNHSNGVGFLDGGGSYVTFYDSETNDFTIVIETMSHDNSECIRPHLPPFNVSDKQEATFVLKGGLVKHGFGLFKKPTLAYWVSDVGHESYFQQKKDVEIKDNKFTITLPVDTVVTLTTVKSGPQHPKSPSIPDSQPFPQQMNDTFDSYNTSSEAKYFADQTGVFEIVQESKTNKVMRQMVTETPIIWCPRAVSPATITVIGNFSWMSVETEVMVKFEKPNTAVYLAGGVTLGGCDIASAGGIYGVLESSGHYKVTNGIALKSVLEYGAIKIDNINMWHYIYLSIDVSRSVV